MRKLLTIDNVPATKSEVTKDVFKILGKSAAWTIGGYLVLTFLYGVVIGIKEDRALISKEEK